MGGYHAGFAVAAVGMAIALVFFVLGRKYLGGAGDVPPEPADARGPPGPGPAVLVLLVGIALAVGVAVWVEGGFGLDTFVDALSYIALAAPVATFLVMFRSPKVTARERSRLRAYIPLFVAAMLFWMIFEQAASTLATYAKDCTDRRSSGSRSRPSSSSRSTRRRSSCSRRCSPGCGSSSTTGRRRP